jgi:hypothetical protein
MDGGGKSRKSHENPENQAVKAPLKAPIFWLGKALSANFWALSLGVRLGSPKHKKNGCFRAVTGTECGSANRAVEE